MSVKSSIRTVENIYEFQFKEKGSLFIGQVYPTQTTDEVNEYLAAIRKEHYNATHVCFAWKLRNDSFKYSDDGEPNGTAGIRIYNAIQHFDLTDMLVIVIRYYGGTKLGVGPLGKAYYHGAHGVLEEAEFVEKVNYSKIYISYDFDQTKNIHHFLGTYEAKITENLFDTRPALECLILPQHIEPLKQKLTEVSRGSIEVKVLEKDLFIG